MPRAPRPKVAVEEVEEPDLHLVDDQDEPDDSPDTEIDDLLASLGGAGRLYATVYRVDAMGQEEFLPGRLGINPQEESSELLERLHQAHGAGRYHIQIRAQGKKGTLGNLYPNIGGTLRTSTAPPPAPAAAPPNDDLRDLLMRQNDKLMELLVGRGPAAPAAPSAPTTIDGTLDQLKKLFGVARTLSREQTSPAIPSWLNTLGEIAAPFLVTLAAAAGAAGAKLQQRPNPNPRQLPTPPSPPPAAGATTGAAPADEASAAAIATGSDAESAQTLACKALITAELAQPTPDPLRLARSMWSIAAADIGPVLSVAPVGVLAGELVKANAELTGHDQLARAVEDELRRLHQPAPAAAAA